MNKPTMLKGYTVRQRVRALHQEIDQAREDFRAKEKELQAEIRLVQSRCEHDRTSFHGDPSGNNDSFKECEDCKKQF